MGIGSRPRFGDFLTQQIQQSEQQVAGVKEKGREKVAQAWQRHGKATEVDQQHREQQQGIEKEQMGNAQEVVEFEAEVAEANRLLNEGNHIEKKAATDFLATVPGLRQQYQAETKRLNSLYGNVAGERAQVSGEVKGINREARGVLEAREIGPEQMGQVWAYVEKRRELGKTALVFEGEGEKLAEQTFENFHEGVHEGVVDINSDAELESKKVSAAGLRTKRESKHTELQTARGLANVVEQTKRTEEEKVKTQERTVNDLKRQERTKIEEAERQRKTLDKLSAELQKLNQSLEQNNGSQGSEKEQLEAWLAETYQPAVDALGRWHQADKERQNSLAKEQGLLLGIEQRLTEARVALTAAETAAQKARQAVQGKEYDISVKNGALQKAQTFISNNRNNQWRAGDVAKEQSELEGLITVLGTLRGDLGGLQADLAEKEKVVVDFKALEAGVIREQAEQKGIVEKYSYGNKIRQEIYELEKLFKEKLEPQKKTKAESINRLENNHGVLSTQIANKTGEITAQELVIQRTNIELLAWQQTILNPQEQTLTQLNEQARPAIEEFERHQAQVVVLDGELANIDRDLARVNNDVSGLERAIRSRSQSLTETEVRNGLLAGFVRKYESLLAQGAEGEHPQTVSLTLGGRKIILRENGQSALPEDLPDLPPIVKETGENGVALVEQAIANPGVTRTELQSGLSKADLVEGLYKEIADEAEGEYAGVVQERIRAKSADIALAKQGVEHFGSQAERESLEAVRLQKLTNASATWESAYGYWDASADIVARYQGEYDSELAKAADIKVPMFGGGDLAVRKKKYEDRAQEILTKNLQPEQQKLTEYTARLNSAEQTLSQLDPSQVVQNESTRVVGEKSYPYPKKSLTKSSSQLLSEKSDLEKRAQQDKARSEALTRVAEAWEKGRMLDYSRDEAEFALSKIESNGRNSLDQIADQLAARINQSFNIINQGFAVREGGPLPSTNVVIKNGNLVINEEGRAERTIDLSKLPEWQALSSMDPAQSPHLRRDLLQKIITEMNNDYFGEIASATRVRIDPNKFSPAYLQSYASQTGITIHPDKYSKVKISFELPSTT